MSRRQQARRAEARTVAAMILLAVVTLVFIAWGCIQIDRAHNMSPDQSLHSAGL